MLPLLCAAARSVAVPCRGTPRGCPEVGDDDRKRRHEACPCETRCLRLRRPVLRVADLFFAARENQMRFLRRAKVGRKRSNSREVRILEGGRRSARQRCWLAGSRKMCSILSADTPSMADCRRVSPAGKKKYFDRSHDIYENKGRILAVIDCSHDIDENRWVSRKSRGRPRC
jgi:hypothetical protein